MERTTELEKLATKTKMESFKAAVAAQDKDSVKRKRSRPAKKNNEKNNKKKKANANNDPEPHATTLVMLRASPVARPRRLNPLPLN